MKIICLSDTHSNHRNFEQLLPSDADMIIHAGDLTRNGSVVGIQDFINWFAGLPYKYKIFVAGNHDFALQEEKSLIKFPDNVIYLENSSITVEGIKIWGSPICSSDPDWAFNFNDADREVIYKKIPDDTNILISHNPPYNVMDKISMKNRHIGCKLLAQKIKTIHLDYVIFGHVHEGAGMVRKGTTTYINTACQLNTFEYPK